MRLWTIVSLVSFISVFASCGGDDSSDDIGTPASDDAPLSEDDERPSSLRVDRCGDFPIEGMGLVTVRAVGVDCPAGFDAMLRYFTDPSAERLGNGRTLVDEWVCGPTSRDPDNEFECERDGQRVVGTFEPLEDL